MTILANINDPDISLTLEQQGDKFRVRAARHDCISDPKDTLDETHDSLGSAIKAITIFYVREWESVFTKNHLSDLMARSLIVA